MNDTEVSRCCPKRHASRALRHGGEEGCERKGGIVRPHPSNLDGWDGERRRGMTGGGPRVVLQQSLGYTEEVPDWFRLRARRVVCTKGVSIRDRSIRARDISTSPWRIYRDSGA